MSDQAPTEQQWNDWVDHADAEAFRAALAHPAHRTALFAQPTVFHTLVRLKFQPRPTFLVFARHLFHAAVQENTPQSQSCVDLLTKMAATSAHGVLLGEILSTYPERATGAVLEWILSGHAPGLGVTLSRGLSSHHLDAVGRALSAGCPALPRQGQAAALSSIPLFLASSSAMRSSVVLPDQDRLLEVSLAIGRRLLDAGASLDQLTGSTTQSRFTVRDVLRQASPAWLAAMEQHEHVRALEARLHAAVAPVSIEGTHPTEVAPRKM